VFHTPQIEFSPFLDRDGNTAYHLAVALVDRYDIFEEILRHSTLELLHTKFDHPTNFFVVHGPNPDPVFSLYYSTHPLSHVSKTILALKGF